MDCLQIGPTLVFGERKENGSFFVVLKTCVYFILNDGSFLFRLLKENHDQQHCSDKQTWAHRYVVLTPFGVMDEAAFNFQHAWAPSVQTEIFSS
mmetsp:Transcript_31145/g.64978  ORF Transcript_31145/g.64978 Transcript_31145/m.64978 type:complete len:94 (-) Transcript_31145:635-916(-)